MSKIKLNNVNFTYKNGFEALKSLSFEVEAGETLAIIGQNGAGKTTTVKMLNGLLKPTSGEVLIDGQNTANTTTAKLAPTVGYVFQNPDDQIFHNIVYEEIEYGAKVQKFDSSKKSKLVRDAIELLGLEKYINDHPYSLPYSIRKLVTVASVIAMDSDVIILDEPTAGQDSHAIKMLGTLIKELKSRGKTVIVITHDMDFVAENFDRTIVMANKELHYDGKTLNIFYDDQLLELAKLEEPHLIKVSKTLNLDVRTLSVDDLANAIRGTK